MLVVVLGGWVIVVVVVVVTVVVTGGIVVVVLEEVDVVPPSQSAVPWERSDTLPPTTISSFESPESCMTPCTPHEFP